MKRLLITLLLVAALLALLVAPPLAGAGVSHHLVTDLGAGEYGSFAEGMAADSHGRLYASVTRWGFYDETTAESNIGELWQVRHGVKRLLASIDLTPYGMLMGVAVDRCDRVYVGLFDSGMPAGIGSGVYRLDRDKLTKVVALPEGAWPNGLAFHGRCLYITDSALGAVWRVRPGCAVAEPASPWLEDPLLAPGDPSVDETMSGIGVNGIAFCGSSLYASVSDYGRVVRLRVRCDGTPGTVKTVWEGAALKSADGIAVDRTGGLWIVTNAGTTGASPSGALYRLSCHGSLRTIADDAGWLNYPTTPVFSTTWHTARTLYIENGAFFGFEDMSSPSIWATCTWVPGLLQL
jgi:sugar lactone lactonase YvrE